MNQVYFIQVGGYVKIGCSSWPNKRKMNLLNGSRLVLPDDIDRHAQRVLVRTLPECQFNDEKAVHALFGEYRAVGEWFHATPAMLRAVELLDYTPIAEQRRAAARARRAAKASAA